MAGTRKNGGRGASQGDAPVTENVLDIDVAQEMETSFLEYAYSVIYSRALPDARDGLKPVQRRILYMMSEMGLRPDRGHVKSSRVVGEVMGKLHPHGDTAIYDALVRLAQVWSMRMPLVDGHGNFGNLDDGPAAPRYTEARLAPAALLLTTSLDEDTADFEPNYDNQLTQPSVLPAQYPNLLVNGTSGIAVGMATNMAPHNLVETITAARHLLSRPDATLEELMRFVPGPDLPGGGRIIGLDGIRDAYETGRGRFTVRATTRVEKVTSRRKGIVVTALPFLVGPEKVKEKLKDAVQRKRVQGVSDFLDLTDRKNGLKLIVELKSGADPDAVLAQLYKHTPLEDSFSINNVALVDGQPRTLGLKSLLQVFLDFRIETVRRRTRFRMRKAQNRLHLVEGLLVAILDIDEVIQVIRGSDTGEEARTRLMGVFDLSEAQAEYILELRLRRLTKFSRIELEAERDELRRQIEQLAEILESEEILRTLVSDELAEVAAAHGDARRTVLLESDGQASTAALPASVEIPDAPCRVLLSGTGLVARSTGAEPVPRSGGHRAAHDVVTSQVLTSTRADVGVLTSRGTVHRLDVVELPALTASAGPPVLSGGTPLQDLVPLELGERAVGLVPLGEDAEGTTLALGTAHGVVKRVNPDLPRSASFDVITLKDADAVVGAAVIGIPTSPSTVRLAGPGGGEAPPGSGAEESAAAGAAEGQGDLLAQVSGTEAATGDGPSPVAALLGGTAAVDAGGVDLVFVTAQAQLLRFGADGVRPQGRAGGGVAGIKLAEGDRVISFSAVVAAAENEVVTVSGTSDTLAGTQSGALKVTTLAQYPSKGRATGGLRAHRFLRGEDVLLGAWVVPQPARACTGSGQPLDLPDADERRDGSGSPLSAPIVAVG